VDQKGFSNRGWGTFTQKKKTCPQKDASGRRWLQRCPKKRGLGGLLRGSSQPYYIKSGGLGSGKGQAHEIKKRVRFLGWELYTPKGDHPQKTAWGVGGWKQHWEGREVSRAGRTPKTARGKELREKGRQGTVTVLTLKHRGRE